jgi:hypothetical protein
LTGQRVQDAIPLGVAAGIEDPENPLGTEAIAISEAIASIYIVKMGVLVLMDLGCRSGARTDANSPSNFIKFGAADPKYSWNQDRRNRKCLNKTHQTLMLLR